MHALPRGVVIAALALVIGACSRGPDAPRLEQHVQSSVDDLFGRKVLSVERLRRQGSAPYQAADDGAKQIIVYYNAVLRFAEVYDPSDWEGLSPTMIANALGAADEGITGLKSGPNLPGAELRAYGSIVLRKSGGAWQPAGVSESHPATPALAAAEAPASQADVLLHRLAELMQKTPARGGRDKQIIAEELSRAVDNIQLRIGEAGNALMVLAGPEGGEYSRFLMSVVAGIRDAAPMQVATSEGSVENVLLIDRGGARLGIVQSDVAAAAVTGAGLFAGTGPLAHLRAAARLFPEPVHVVVRANSGITSLPELVGRRVALGAVSSGTRQTARRLLEVAGIDVRQLEDTEADSPQEALDRLIKGEIDAVIEVVSAPWRQLETAMHMAPLVLVPLDLNARLEIATGAHGLFPLTIPARTYPGQAEPVPTVAATALLLVRDDVPDEVVTSTLDLLYAAAASGSAGVQATRLSKDRALDGVTIPLHPAAARYFSRSSRHSQPSPDASVP